MVDVQTNVIINAPMEQVAQFATNPDNAPKWYVNINSVQWKSPKPLVIGSLIAFTARFLGKDLAYTYEVTDWKEGRFFVMKTAEGPFPMETRYTWENLENNSTKMTLQNRGKPSGFSKLMAPFMRLAMKKANQKDLQKLKTILETQQTS